MHALGGTDEVGRMNWLIVAGFAAVVLASVVASITLGRASVLLTSEQLNEVIALRALRSAKRTLTIFPLFLVLAALIALGLPAPHVSLAVLTVLAGAWAIWSHVTYFRGLRSLSLPASYLEAARRSRVVAYCGWLAFLLFVGYDAL
jgi:hypothetical protein